MKRRKMLALVAGVAGSAALEAQQQPSPQPQLGVAVYDLTAAQTAKGFAFPYPRFAVVFRNGVFQAPGYDYAVAGNTFGFLAAVAVSDRVTVLSLD